jgi:hypothetical protein
MLKKLTDIETTKAQTNKKATQLADVDAILMKPPRKKIAYIRRIHRCIEEEPSSATKVGRGNNTLLIQHQRGNHFYVFLA